MSWIKVWRQLLESRVFRDAILLKVWIWCLLKAVHKEQWVPIKTGRGTTTVLLKPGQFFFGRHQGAKELSLPPSTLYRKMQCLCVLAMIALKSDTHCSIVTILNWETFQGEWTGNRTPNGHPKNTYKKDKNVKKKAPAEILSEITELEKRYSDKETINRIFLAISSTRKTNRISDTVKLSIFRSWEEHPIETVMYGIRTFLEKGYHIQGKDEKYLLGIIRNQKSNPSPIPEFKSTGSPLLDNYNRRKIQAAGINS